MSLSVSRYGSEWNWKRMHWKLYGSKLTEKTQMHVYWFVMRVVTRCKSRMDRLIVSMMEVAASEKEVCNGSGTAII